MHFLFLFQRLQSTTEKEAAKILFESFSQKFYIEIVNFIDNLEADIKVNSVYKSGKLLQNTPILPQVVTTH